MGSRFREGLESRLLDTEFAKGFGAEAAKTDFALTLAEARLRCGVTQTDLANRLGTTQSYIAKLERGDANPTIGKIGETLAVVGLRLLTSAVPLTPAPYSMAQTQEVVRSDSEEIRFPYRPSPGITANTKSDAHHPVALRV